MYLNSPPYSFSCLNWFSLCLFLSVVLPVSSWRHLSQGLLICSSLLWLSACFTAQDVSLLSSGNFLLFLLILDSLSDSVFCCLGLYFSSDGAHQPPIVFWERLNKGKYFETLPVLKCKAFLFYPQFSSLFGSKNSYLEFIASLSSGFYGWFLWNVKTFSAFKSFLCGLFFLFSGNLLILFFLVFWFHG